MHEYILVHESNHMTLDGEQEQIRSCVENDNCVGVALKQRLTTNERVIHRSLRGARM